jgi:hypothetical protein
LPRRDTRYRLSPLRDSYPATIMPLPRCRIPILTVAGLIKIAALHLTFDQGRIGIERYWQPPEAARRAVDPEDATERLDELLRRAGAFSPTA